jgi:hypothetical protein
MRPEVGGWCRLRDSNPLPPDYISVDEPHQRLTISHSAALANSHSRLIQAQSRHIQFERVTNRVKAVRTGCPKILPMIDAPAFGKRGRASG